MRPAAAPAASPAKKAGSAASEQKAAPKPAENTAQKSAEAAPASKEAEQLKQARALYHWVLDSVQEGEESDGRRVGGEVAAATVGARSSRSLRSARRLPVRWALAESRISLRYSARLARPIARCHRCSWWAVARVPPGSPSRTSSHRTAPFRAISAAKRPTFWVASMLRSPRPQ